MKERNLYFILKSIARIVHMISFAFIFGNVSYDYFMHRRITDLHLHTAENTPDRRTYIGLSISFSILLILSGIAMLLIQINEKTYIHDNHYHLWMRALLSKLGLSIFLTPLLESIISIGTKDQDRIEDIGVVIRFWAMLIITIASTLIRVHRAHYIKTQPRNYPE